MRVVQLESPKRVAEAVADLGLPYDMPVLVVVGGAGGLDSATGDLVDQLMREVVLPAVIEIGAALVDGGTDSGVMRSLGRAACERGWAGPIIGVAVSALVGPGGVPLEPHHTHVVLVPGTRWGDESTTLAEVATLVARGHPTVTLLLNGGAVSRDDVAQSLARNRPVLAAGTTGRLAAELAADPPPGVVALPDGPVHAQRTALLRLLSPPGHR